MKVIDFVKFGVRMRGINFREKHKVKIINAKPI